MPEMVRVRMRTAAACAEFSCGAGQVVTIPKKLAADIITGGFGEEVAEEAPAVSVEEKPAEPAEKAPEPRRKAEPKFSRKAKLLG